MWICIYVYIYICICIDQKSTARIPVRQLLPRFPPSSLPIVRLGVRDPIGGLRRRRSLGCLKHLRCLYLCICACICLYIHGFVGIIYVNAL